MINKSKINSNITKKKKKINNFSDKPFHQLFYDISNQFYIL